MALVVGPVRHIAVAPAETLAVTIAGEGSPVVIVPGMLGGAFGFRKVTADLVAAKQRVIIIDPLGTGDSASGELGLALRFAPPFRLLGGKHLIMHHIASGLRNSSADPGWVTDSVIEQYAAPYARDVGAALTALKRIAYASEPWPLLERISALRVPVILLLGTGAHEPVLKSQEVAAMQQRVPDLRIVNVPSAGEYIEEEQPLRVAGAVMALRLQVESR